MAKKITNRDYFEIIAAILNNADITDIFNEAVDAAELNVDELPTVTTTQEWVQHQIDLIEGRKEAEARRKANKPADELTTIVFNTLTRSVETAEQVFERVVVISPTNAEGKDLTVGMVRSRLSKLVKDGKIDKIDIKVNDKTRKGYCRFEVDPE